MGVRYDRSEAEWDKCLEDEERIKVASTWTQGGTLDRWRHERMLESIRPFINNTSHWLTVGDGRFGTDANFIISSGGTILADNGGNPASAAKVNINSNGTATFAGLITANGNILSNRTGSTQTVFQGTLSGVTKVNIQAGGSANFASHLITGSANSVTSTSAHGSYIGEGIVEISTRL